MPQKRLSRDGREDARLVIRCRQGEPEAFAPLVIRYRDSVFNIAYRMVGDIEEAKDLAQEAFTRAFEGLHTYDSSMPFRPWIMGIGSNTVIDHLRRKRKSRDVPLEAAFCSQHAADTGRASVCGGEPLAPEAETPENVSMSNETSRAVQRALLELPDNYRAVVVLHHVEGLRYEDISKALGVPRNTAKTWAHRARGMLCRSLEGEI